jgi:hypothetical protein
MSAPAWLVSQAGKLTNERTPFTFQVSKRSPGCPPSILFKTTFPMFMSENPGWVSKHVKRSFQEDS